ncbi:alpha/beta fold hydrolase [Paractinoplanes lichenicola]|uniref:Alpha/beta fold hydrolase n=1 Tax=Paractinoplanes lichenicola TaxID=2802976 RepID=A0ABS1W1G2_9ACTN|nr:alpha/beta hydrolase [Actinoplanes lichenicola]MBL7260581.1 alpha/beta fold hydrolase [Actinoplanes lichenicola]
MFRSVWTTARGLRIHDRSGPAPAALPVVLLHGLAVSHRYLMPTAAALAPWHPVVVPDLPGFGHSDKPSPAYDVGQHADVMAAWLAARGLRRVALAGHSFGAEVAARLAVVAPDTVAALVLAGPTCDPHARTRRGLIGRWLTDTAVEAPWQVPVLARDVADAKPWRVLATVGHSVRNPVEDDLIKVAVPTLVLGGSLDPVAPARWRAEVAALTGGTAVTIPQGAHNVLTTSPRRSAAAIVAHLRDV